MKLSFTRDNLFRGMNLGNRDDDPGPATDSHTDTGLHDAQSRYQCLQIRRVLGDTICGHWLQVLRLASFVLMIVLLIRISDDRILAGSLSRTPCRLKISASR